ncbi:unnamed protein product, partial [Discosporangium mesarthrocarpum]
MPHTPRSEVPANVLRTVEGNESLHHGQLSSLQSTPEGVHREHLAPPEIMIPNTGGSGEGEGGSIRAPSGDDGVNFQGPCGSLGPGDESGGRSGGRADDKGEEGFKPLVKGWTFTGDRHSPPRPCKVVQPSRSEGNMVTLLVRHSHSGDDVLEAEETRAPTAQDRVKELPGRLGKDSRDQEGCLARKEPEIGMGSGGVRMESMGLADARRNDLILRLHRASILENVCHSVVHHLERQVLESGRRRAARGATLEA